MSDKLTPRINYVIGAGDTTKTKFDFKFPIQDKNDLKAITSDGVVLQNYTVQISKDGNGGSINLANPLAVGTKITIYREMTYTRQTLFRENEDFRASVINSEFDRMIMLLQQAGLQSKDSIRNPLSDNQMDMVLPTADVRKDSILGFDDTGKTKVYKTMTGAYKEVEKLSKQAKDSADNAKRDRLLTDKTKTAIEKTKQSFENDYVKKSDLKQGLPTKIFTQDSGKFFVRNADNSLPSGIDSTKVWSLTDQKTANGGTMPSGKNHIELPARLNAFSVAGAGSSGDTYGGGRNAGGATSLGSLITANGGRVRSNWQQGIEHTGNGRGGSGGNGSNASNAGSWGASNGVNGDLKQKTIILTAGQVIDYTIGAGGSAKSGFGGSVGGKGADGWIEVEYV